MIIRSALTAVALLIYHALPANACPEGYYSDDFGICWPGGGTVAETLDPTKGLKTVAAIVQALAGGDSDRAVAALGDYLMNSTNCIACGTVSANLLPNVPKDKLNYIVGRGFIVFGASGGNPSVVIIDTVQNLVTESKIPLKNPVPSPPAPKERGQKSHTIDLSCILQNANNILGLSTEVITVVSENSSGKVPNVDVYKDDKILLQAPLCSEQNDPANGTTSLTSAHIIFDSFGLIPGPEGSLRYYVVGTEQP